MVWRETCSLLCTGNYGFRYTSKLFFFYKYKHYIVRHNSINVKNFYVIRDLVGNNNNNIANCIFYLTKMWSVRKADNLTTILCRCHEIWEP